MTMSAPERDAVPPTPTPTPTPTVEELRQETLRVRRLQFIARLCFETIATNDIDFDEAVALMGNLKRIALDLFPGKEVAFEIIYGRRLRALIELRFGRSWV